ncbi:hypothetical protein [Novosphingobium malaysiense]|uniref:Uncharacterized protein n=1 Tax=Novosphingobium malaysiense TaxID=1348853 RepID=A0A0B1ZLB5_9SPHN|nr:hypothetical protein [Novosphingobium malaysiense]KHK89978.1 hypothetical protein LK12_18995 [Novosphingobium malaysiense]
METQGREVHVDQDEARAGSTPRIVRYVLLISLALAVIALSAIWIIGALSAPENPRSVDTTTQQGSVDVPGS